MARTRVANHKGKDDWKDMGPKSPAPLGPIPERHTHGAPVEDDTLYGAYFSTPGHRPLMSYQHDDIEGTYAVV